MYLQQPPHNMLFYGHPPNNNLHHQQYKFSLPLPFYQQQQMLPNNQVYPMPADPLAPMMMSLHDNQSMLFPHPQAQSFGSLDKATDHYRSYHNSMWNNFPNNNDNINVNSKKNVNISSNKNIDDIPNKNANGVDRNNNENKNNGASECDDSHRSNTNTTESFNKDKSVDINKFNQQIENKKDNNMQNERITASNVSSKNSQLKFDENETFRNINTTKNVSLNNKNLDSLNNNIINQKSDKSVVDNSNKKSNDNYAIITKDTNDNSNNNKENEVSVSSSGPGSKNMNSFTPKSIDFNGEILSNTTATTNINILNANNKHGNNEKDKSNLPKPQAPVSCRQLFLYCIPF